jgi:hypothetical protein
LLRPLEKVRRRSIAGMQLRYGKLKRQRSIPGRMTATMTLGDFLTVVRVTVVKVTDGFLTDRLTLSKRRHIHPETATHGPAKVSTTLAGSRPRTSSDRWPRTEVGSLHARTVLRLEIVQDSTIEASAP